MTIRALFDLKKGDEVTVSYMPPVKAYEERNIAFTQKWGFQCECRLCTLDRQEPSELAKQRENLINKFNEELK